MPQGPQTPEPSYPSEQEQTIKIEKGGVDAETTKWQLDPNEVIADLKHHLKGEKWDPTKGDRGEWVSEVEPMANKEGIQRMVWFVKNFLNKNSQLSWFSDKDINRNMQYFRKELARILRRKRKDFDIERSDLSNIHMAISQTVWAALNRARLGGEKEFIKDTEKRTVRMSQGESDSSEGIMSKLNPF